MCFLWWFSPRELWVYWLVHIAVPHIGLQIPLAPWVLSLAPLMQQKSQWKSEKEEEHGKVLDTGNDL
jgi:hypothetical protein